jgi:hypothetical protein
MIGFLIGFLFGVIPGIFVYLMGAMRWGWKWIFEKETWR